MNLFGFNIEKAPQGVYVGRSSLTNVTQWFYEAIAGKQSSSGEPVNEETAMQIAAVFSCIRVLSETTAQVPIHYYQKTANGKQARTNDELEFLINDEPNPVMDSFVFRETMAYNAYQHGNAYAYIERDSNNKPIALMPIQPKLINEINISPDGKRMFYDVEGYEAEVPDRNMIHVRILSPDGYIGRSFLETAQEQFGGALAADKFSNRFWSNSATPGMVVKTPHQLDQSAVERLRDSLNKFRGQGQGGALPLDKGMDVEKFDIPQKDAQFLETKRFSKEEIAGIYRVPMPFINELSQSNYSNISALSLMFTKYTMVPLFKRFEMEYNRKLRPRTENGRNNFFEHDVDGLLRGDAEARANYYKTLAAIGSITRNEVRDKENMNTLNIDGMDTPYKQMQDVPVDTDTASIKKSFEANGKKNGKYATNNN